jgi:hypothetical protein
MKPGATAKNAGKVPTLPLDIVQRRIRNYWNPYEHNPHKGLLATTRSGKSYLIRHGILPVIPHARIVLIDVKPGGERTWEGWGNDVESLSYGFGRGSDGTANYRVMLQTGRRGKDQIRRVIDIVSAEGEVIFIMDDSRKITANDPGLGLRNHVDALLTDGAGIGISVILAANSTVWATSTLRDQCGIYFLGPMSNADERKKFANIIGLPREYQPILETLKPRQFLYSDQFDGRQRLAITGL